MSNGERLMKYINREYGIPQRPPEFKDYYEETNIGPMVTKDNYPDKCYLGAGLDSAVPYGAMLVGKGGTRWGIKISCNIRGRWIESDDYLREIGRLYAVSEDGNFTYFAYGDMTATIVKYSKNALVMSLATINNIKLRITYYLMKPCEGEIRAIDNVIKGAANYLAVIPGEVELNNQQSVFRNRYEVVAEPKDKEYFTAKTYRKPIDIIKQDNSITYEYELYGKESRLFVYAAIGYKGIFNDYPEENELIEGTSMEEIAYSTNKKIGRGLLGRSYNGFLNSSMYHRIYNPFIKGFMFSESRTKIDENFAFNAIDLNAATIIAAFIGDYDTSKRQLELSMHDEILSPLTLWIVYLRTRDYELLKRLYKSFSKKFVPKSDLVICSDKSQVAYCMTGSPLKEMDNKKAMYSLDKSCFNLLAMDIMERIALIVGAPESSLYASAKEVLKERINDTLWNPKLGIYMNRYVKGEFASAIGITSFYPLVAGAVDGLDKLEKLMMNLRDKKRFYGERMVPTLSKDHPEYGVKFTSSTGEIILPYQGYRGTIVPYMNYLIYMGLVRYGVYDLASEIAISSANLWNKRYRKGNYEVLDNYLPSKTFTIDRKSMQFDTEKILEKTERHSLSGNLMAMMGLSELIDLEYFRDDMDIAIRFGTMIKGENSVSRINLLGHLFNVNVDDYVTELFVDNIDVFSAEGGKVIVRQFSESNNGANFIILADSDVSINIKLPILGLCKEAQALSFKLLNGCSEVNITNGKLNIKKIH